MGRNSILSHVGVGCPRKSYFGSYYRVKHPDGRERGFEPQRLVPKYRSTNSKCLNWCRLAVKQTIFSLAPLYRSWSEKFNRQPGKGNGEARPFQGCSRPELSIDYAKLSITSPPGFVLFI
jgi:hypothetical protein